jgi:hypothetical protein
MIQELALACQIPVCTGMQKAMMQVNMGRDQFSIDWIDSLYPNSTTPLHSNSTDIKTKNPVPSLAGEAGGREQKAIFIILLSILL